MSITSDDLEKIAKEYHLNAEFKDKFIEDIGQRHCFKWINDQLGSRDNRVLELGYGDGVITRHLIDSGYRPHIIEGAPSLANLAKETFGSLVSVHQTMFEEFAPTSLYDRIIASHVLEHVADPRALLRAFSRWLEPKEGRLIIIVPNSQSIHRRLAVLMGLQPKLDTLSARDHIVGHKRVYNMRELNGDITSAGFSVASVQGFFLKVLPNSMMLDYSAQLVEALHDVSDDLPAEMCANIGMVVGLPDV